MTTIELLQQIGLNKYEAEAYSTLLAEGPLTGYELGKRSQVPLSRSYETLERLTSKGLALVQPADPPRYLAEDPQQFLKRIRTTMTETLDTLTTALTTLSRPDAANEFWVLRARQPILQRAQTMIANAQHKIDITLSTGDESEVTQVLALASARGYQVSLQHILPTKNPDTQLILLLVDNHEALIGTLTPIDRCQAIVSTNPALVTVLRTYFARQHLAEVSVPVSSTPVHPQNNEMNWLAWEDRKQRRLWNLNKENQVA